MIPGQPQEAPDEPVHLPVAEEDRALELGLVFGRRPEREAVRIEVAPVLVLEVSRAVQEERGEMRPDACVIPPEDVPLQSVHRRDALPAIPAPALAKELSGDRRRGGRRQAVREHEAEESEALAGGQPPLGAGVLVHVSLDEPVVGAQPVRSWLDAGRPRVRQEGAVEPVVVPGVHAAGVGGPRPARGPRARPPALRCERSPTGSRARDSSRTPRRRS